MNNKVTYTTQGVHLENTGVTNLFTTESSNGNFVITNIYYTPTSITPTSGTFGTPRFNIGYNSPDYGDFMENRTIDGDNVLYEGVTYSVFTMLDITLGLSSLNQPSGNIPSSTQLKINITTSATGVSQLIMDVTVEGYYPM